ncbi:MAG TPA: 4,5-DOPA dioxygenase extradiol [Thermoleophilia bacterium]|nr:4,5-DOPA dioxygenase extradiol [Thermoleophilia bacterium]
MGGVASDYGARLPAIFVGHGSPLNCVADNAFTRDMRRLGEALPRPAAVLVVSAHWQTSGSFVTAGAHPETIYDFYGFPAELYEVRYPSPGSPQVAALVNEATGGVVRPAERGIDHAAWMVLRNVYPAADVPVLEMSLDLTLDEGEHYELGRRLAALRDQNVLVMASGNIVHNLYEVDWAQDALPDQRTIDYDAWVRDAVAGRRHDELIDYRVANPLSRWAAPTAEHYLPLLYTLALQGDDERIETVHESFQHATVSMRSFITA